jgi:hypothetical protein
MLSRASLRPFLSFCHCCRERKRGTIRCPRGVGDDIFAFADFSVFSLVTLLPFDTSTGNVTDVTVTQSTGSAVLDQAAINAFRQWHGQPNGPNEFSLTISFP